MPEVGTFNADEVISLGKEQIEIDASLIEAIKPIISTVKAALNEALAQDERNKDVDFSSNHTQGSIKMTSVFRSSYKPATLVKFNLGKVIKLLNDYTHSSGMQVMSSRDVYDVTLQERENHLSVMIPDEILSTLGLDEQEIEVA